MNAKELENIFRNSDSSDELFDAFHFAMTGRIKDEELYKKLLWNRALSVDEVSMYAQKVCSEFPEFSYNIFFWTAQIFESISSYGEYYDHALKYLMKSSESDKIKHEPYLKACLMYNPEIDVPEFNNLIEFVKKGIECTEFKSKLCFALSDLFHMKGQIKLMQTYKSMGEQFVKEGK